LREPLRPQPGVNRTGARILRANTDPDIRVRIDQLRISPAELCKSMAGEKMSKVMRLAGISVK
jgi:hypothetical protein